MKFVHKDNPKKLLFLDIDGVLNSRSFYSYSLQYKIELFFRGRKKTRQYRLSALDLLKKIHDKTGCTIIMSSSWRSFYFSRDHRKYCKDLKRDLLKRGIIIHYKTSHNYNKDEYLKQNKICLVKNDDGSYSSKTKDIKKKNTIDIFYERGYQIYEFIRNWKEKDITFAILDDDSGDLNLFNKDGYTRFVQTSWYGRKGGLRKYHVQKIINILNDSDTKSIGWMEQLYKERLENGQNDFKQDN